MSRFIVTKCKVLLKIILGDFECIIFEDVVLHLLCYRKKEKLEAAKFNIENVFAAHFSDIVRAWTVPKPARPIRCSRTPHAAS
jgi:hypothetical protein